MKLHTPECRRTPYLDGWRGLAILLVYLGHFAPMRAYPLGPFGVDLFFILSGRLMAEILFVRRMELTPFFVHRLSRIYPGLLAFAGLAALGFLATPLAVGPLGVLSAFTFTINYASLYVHRTGLFDHLWSLCVEMHAYVLLGLIAFAARRFNVPARNFILTLGLAALLNGVLQSDLLHRAYFEVFWRSDVAVAPILIACALFLFLGQNQTRPPALVVPTLLILAIVCKAFDPVAVLSFGFGTLALALAMTWLDRAPEWLLSALSFAPLRQIGIWSYSLYLWQQPFYKLHAMGRGWWTLPAGIACGLTSFYLIEQPARRSINAHLRPASILHPIAALTHP
jgi:peptidoglycan/LPS O-acetylase OafA/YrhL